MRCISLWQPWASLWLATPRVKIHETRHWQIRRQWKEWQPGDRIVVHAAVRFVKDHDGAFASILREAFGPYWYKALPTGALIGTIAVDGCTKTDMIYPPERRPETMTAADRKNYECGDWYPGRFAWSGSDPQLFPEPIPFKGAQGIFSVPDEILPAMGAA